MTGANLSGKLKVPQQLDQSDEVVDVVLFYDPRAKNGVFSNFFLSDLKWQAPERWDFPTEFAQELKFDCVEQFVMFQKAIKFNDLSRAREIMATSQDPAECKKIGRSIRGFEESEWVQVRN